MTVHGAWGPKQLRYQHADYQRMQRDVRDLGTYWSHNTPSQFELLAQTLAMLHLGFPKDQLPATGA
jgi:hypothetical protein